MVGTFMIAGCNNPSNEETTSSENPRATTLTDGSPIDTTTSSDPKSLNVIDTNIVGNDFETGVIGKIENTSEQRFSRIEAKMDFLNHAGDVLSDSTTTIIIRELKPGQIWEAYVLFLDESSKLAEGKLSVDKATAGSVPEPPVNIELLEHRLKPPSEKYVGPNVVGRAKNTGDSVIKTLVATATFIGKNGNLLSSGRKRTSERPPGDVWSFNLDFRGYTAAASEEVDDYEVFLTVES